MVLLLFPKAWYSSGLTVKAQSLFKKLMHYAKKKKKLNSFHFTSEMRKLLEITGFHFDWNSPKYLLLT